MVTLRENGEEVAGTRLETEDFEDFVHHPGAPIRFEDSDFRIEHRSEGFRIKDGDEEFLPQNRS